MKSPRTVYTTKSLYASVIPTFKHMFRGIAQVSTLSTNVQGVSMNAQLCPVFQRSLSLENSMPDYRAALCECVDVSRGPVLHKEGMQ